MPSNHETFGPFELLHRLGTGGMAEAFLARVAGAPLGDEFVIKRMLREISGDPESELAFIEEAELASSMVHPNIVRTLPAGRVNGRIYIPMELVYGDDLRSIMLKSLAKRTIPSDAFIVHVIAQAARGLAYAHELEGDDGESLGLVHRDISPPNVMVGLNGVAQVVDFGIARLRPGASAVRTGQLKGKFAYMSPEQALGMELDQRSDIFGLGIVLFELLTRKRLFRDDAPLKTIRNVAKANIPAPSSMRADFPRELEAIVLKALARSTRDRYQSADALADALEGYLASTAPDFTVGDVAAYMQAVCGDLSDQMRALVSPDYGGPRSVDELNVPELPATAPATSTAPTSSADDFAADLHRADQIVGDANDPLMPKQTNMRIAAVVVLVGILALGFLALWLVL